MLKPPSANRKACTIAKLSMLALVTAGCGVSQAVDIDRWKTGVTFKTADLEWQRLLDAAEAKSALNIVQFTPTMKVLVEGGGYDNAWIETQPMGGEMYAKRNLEVALNNQLVFMLTQRSDGRLPGMVLSTRVGQEQHESNTVAPEMIWMPEPKILADYEMFQGFCFPQPAWKMYFWTGRDKAYLRKLYEVLEGHDAYLWRTRDSNSDGILESWCVWDTGEDGSSRFHKLRAPYRWPFDFPPNPDKVDSPNRYWSGAPEADQVLVPLASMDVMSYSYDARTTLARIAEELGNGRAAYWKQQAEEVRRRLIEGLWDPQRYACFDRDRHDRKLEELIHNNLRVMYHGTFTQRMADQFIKHHLLNPEEFWTPLPLPSIAFNDPLYRDHAGNNWSGQPQGLTYQRAIGALENYGHYAEVTLLGQKLIPVLIGNEYTFSQQLDTRTGKDMARRKRDGYGPMMLAALEYISRMYGLHLDVAEGRVWWSSLGDKDFTYTQQWGDRTWSMSAENGTFTASLNGKTLFSCTGGVRVVTNLEGAIQQVVGIHPERQNIHLKAGTASFQRPLTPNHVLALVDGKLTRHRVVPFDYPYNKEHLQELSNLNLPAVVRKDWMFKDFPILAWWPPPGTKTLDDFKRYKEAGFTLYAANPDAGFDRALELAKQAGLPVMPHRSMGGFDVPAPTEPVAFPENDANVVGWITHDEPGWYKAAVEATSEVHALMRSDPARWTLFNNLPLNRPQPLPVLEIAETALRNGMPVLSYDNYVVLKDGTDRTKEHFDNLADARRLSLYYDVPFWAFALTTAHREYRRPSESDLRWKQFTNLAYGARGLWYFCYWGPHRWEDRGWDTQSIVDSATGEPTELYHQVRKLNETVLAMGDVLLGLTSEAVAHTRPPQGHAAFEKDTHWIADIQAQDALVGFFRNAEGERYAMVVNKLHGKGMSSKETADTIELTFAPDIQAVEAVSWLDGTPGKLPLHDRKTSLRVHGGTGVLIKAK